MNLGASQFAGLYVKVIQLFDIVRSSFHGLALKSSQYILFLGLALKHTNLPYTLLSHLYTMMGLRQVGIHDITN